MGLVVVGTDEGRQLASGLTRRKARLVDLGWSSAGRSTTGKCSAPSCPPPQLPKSQVGVGGVRCCAANVHLFAQQKTRSSLFNAGCRNFERTNGRTNSPTLITHVPRPSPSPPRRKHKRHAGRRSAHSRPGHRELSESNPKNDPKYLHRQVSPLRASAPTTRLDAHLQT